MDDFDLGKFGTHGDKSHDLSENVVICKIALKRVHFQYKAIRTSQWHDKSIIADIFHSIEI